MGGGGELNRDFSASSLLGKSTVPVNSFCCGGFEFGDLIWSVRLLQTEVSVGSRTFPTLGPCGRNFRQWQTLRVMRIFQDCAFQHWGYLGQKSRHHLTWISILGQSNWPNTTACSFAQSALEFGKSSSLQNSQDVWMLVALVQTWVFNWTTRVQQACAIGWILQLKWWFYGRVLCSWVLWVFRVLEQVGSMRRPWTTYWA